MSKNKSTQENIDLFNYTEKVIDQSIESEISQSYIDYAMSVIVSRALPDTRDGMKPVHRRILHAMNELGFNHTAKHRKSATVVGEVIGKYHPHGDSSVYEAMVKLAQPWAMRYPLVDGQGNFWSIDGDGAAASRYTEVKMTKLTEYMLENIKEDTVDWRPNYDNSTTEPITLPTRFPNHLCNGTMGIAVGMATNMAPHNLTEVIDATLLLISKSKKQPDLFDEEEDENEDKLVRNEFEDVSIDEIMEIIKGPDFPTWGQMFDSESIKTIYSTGKGSIIVRGKTHIENDKNNTYIIIDEIPYQVTKSSIVEKIWELVIDRKIDGIVDIVDASAKNKIRVMIEIKKWFNHNDILLQLYKYTNLQTSFALNNVTLVEEWSQPKLLNIKDLLVEFILYRRNVVLRRSKFLLQKAQDRLHILEGLKRAIDIIDEIIKIIRSSQTTEEAKQKLISEFEFTEPQAEYILKLTLGRLVWLEIQKVLDEIEEKTRLIAELNEIISNPIKLDQVVSEEIAEVKNKFGDERKTEIVDDIWDMSWDFKKLVKMQDLKKEDVLCLIDNNHNVKVLYQSRIMNVPEDTIHLVNTNNQDKLIVITDIGELVIQRLKDLWSWNIKQDPLDPKKHRWLKWNIILCETMEGDYENLCLITSNNSLKKISKDLLLKFKKFPTVIMNLDDKEKIISIVPVKKWDHIWVISSWWRMVMFDEAWLRPMWKTSGWVKGIELQGDDQVANMFVHRWEEFILVYSHNAAKLLNLDDLKMHKRGHKGQIVAELSSNQQLIWWLAINEWNIRIKLDNEELKTLHNDTMKLDEPESKLEQITHKSIIMVYRPREEKDTK